MKLKEILANYLKKNIFPRLTRIYSYIFVAYDLDDKLNIVSISKKSFNNKNHVLI